MAVHALQHKPTLLCPTHAAVGRHSPLILQAGVKPGEERGAFPAFASRSDCFRCGAPKMAGRPDAFGGGRERGGGRDRGGGRERGGGRGREDAEFRRDFAGTRCFVENLSFETDWPSLKDHFLAEGYPVVYASVSTDRATGRSKGHGIIQFETVHAAEHAVEFMKGTLIDGRDINIRPDMQERSRRQVPSPATGSGLYDDGRGRGAGRSAYDDFDDDGRGGGESAGGYTREVGDTAVVDVQLVESMLAERSGLRRRRDFAGADALREELSAMGVSVVDKEQVWFVSGGGRGGAPRAVAERTLDDYDDDDDDDGAKPWLNREWRRVKGSDDTAVEIDDAEVLLRLAARDDARARRDFGAADALLDELLRMGVGVDDARRQKCWWLGARVEGRGAGGGSLAGAGRRQWYRDEPPPPARRGRAAGGGRARGGGRGGGRGGRGRAAGRGGSWGGY